MSICVRSAQDFETFNKQHGGTLDGLGLTYDAVFAKARILALLSLASQSNELTFAAIKVCLPLPNALFCGSILAAFSSHHLLLHFM
jgi:hypothetical protein